MAFEQTTLMRRSFLAIALLLMYVPAWGATYYVDATGGNDSNSGTTTTTPWKTIYKVNSSYFFAGDSILFKRGETWREQLVVPSSGGAGNPITFGAYSTGVDPIFTGASNSDWTPVVKVSGNNYITIENFKFTALTSNINADFIINGSTNITIKNCALEKISVGHQILITGNSTDILIDRNTFGTTLYTGVRIEGTGTIRRITVSNNTFTNMNTTKTEGHSAIQISTGATQDMEYLYFTGNKINGSGTVGIGADAASASHVQYLYIRNNTITNCGGTEGIGEAIAYGGIDTEVSGNILTKGTGTAVWGILAYLTNTNQARHSIFGNTVSGFVGGISLNPWAAGTFNNVSVYRNTLFSNTVGIRSYPDVGDALWINSRIYYNLIYSNVVGIQIINSSGINIYNNVVHGSYGVKIDGNSSSTTLKNNIILTSSNYLVAVSTGSRTSFVSDYNIYYNGIWLWGDTLATTTLADWRTASNQESHSLNSDPLFVSTATPDFRLKVGSPAIDAGTNVSLTTDYEGRPVPVGNATDIGAFEYQGICTPSAPSGLYIRTGL